MANVIEILIKATDQSSGVLGSISSKLGGVLGGALKVGALGAAGGLGALTGFLTLSAKEAMDAQATQAELATVLKSTGGVAGWTADAANNLAEKYSKVTKFSDDAIVEGQSMLLTFTKIGKDVFPAATEATLNLAQKFGSMETASVQVGKALNDPIAGVSALQRVGVTFSEVQKKQIADFMAVGDIASAQKVILKELGTEFGGLAVAAGGTLSGKITILRNRFLNFAESIGTKLIPVVNKGLDALVNFADLVEPPLTSLFNTASNVAGVFSYVTGWLVKAFEAGQQAGGLFGGISEALNAMFYVFADGQTTFFSKILESFGMSTASAQEWGLKIVGTIGPVVETFTNGLQRLVLSLGWFVDDIKKFGLADAILGAFGLGKSGAAAGGESWVEGVTTAFGLSRNAAEKVTSVMQTMLNGLASAWSVAGPALGKLADWFIGSALPGVLNFITDTAIPALGDFIGWLGDIWTKASPYLAMALDWFINTGLPQVLNFIETKAIPGVERFTEIVVDIWTGIKPTLDQLMDWFITTALPSIVRFIENPVIPTFAKIGSTLVTMWNTVSPYLGQFLTWFTASALPAIRTFILNDAVPAMDKIKTTLSGIWNAVQPGLSSLYNWFVDSLGWVKSNVIDPVIAALTNLQNKWNEIKSLPGDIASKFNVGSLTPGWIPGWASGGYTGNGPSNEIAGNVHRREWVVPENGALVLRGDSGSQSVIVNIYDDTMSKHPHARAYGEELAVGIRSGLRFAGGGVASG